jgi:DNA mismatch repair protein MSH5
LRHLLALGSDCPKVIATTHFHEVLSTGILEPQKLPITFVHMEVMFTTRAGEIINGTSPEVTKGESITYLYRYVHLGSYLSRSSSQRTVCGRAVNGLSLESHAARCAELFGVPDHVVQRAQYVTYVLSGTVEEI